MKAARQLQSMKKRWTLLEKILSLEMAEAMGKLHTALRCTFYQNICAGLQYKNSFGVYASDATAYDTFRPFYDRLLNKLHPQFTSASIQPPDELEVESLRSLTLSMKSGPEVVSVAVDIYRNIQGHKFCSVLTLVEVEKVENLIRQAVAQLQSEGIFQNVEYESFNETTIARLRRDGILPQDEQFCKMTSAKDYWPSGRGVFSLENGCSLVVNAQEHVQISAKRSDGKIGEAFVQAIMLIKNLESKMQWAISQRLGSITCDPRLIGSGVKLSATIRMENLVAEKLKKTASADRSLQISEVEKDVFRVSQLPVVGKTSVDTLLQFKEKLGMILRACGNGREIIVLK